MENLEALDGCFFPLWDSSEVRIYDPASRDLNPEPIGLTRERLNSKPLSRHPMVLMSNSNQSAKLRHRPPLTSVSYYLTTDSVELHCSPFLTRTPGNTSWKQSLVNIWSL
ncbi:unnamed protein product [Schistosoma guineensis]|nr:unnamed protein product [Schistosoma guineensis]